MFDLCFRDSESAMVDLSEAVRLAPQNRDVRRILLKIRQEMSGVSVKDGERIKELSSSIDTLNGDLTNSITDQNQMYSSIYSNP